MGCIGIFNNFLHQDKLRSAGEVNVCAFQKDKDERKVSKEKVKVPPSLTPAPGTPHLSIIEAIKCSNVQGTSQAIRLPKDDSDGPEGQSKTAFDPSTDNVSYRHKCLNALFVRKLVHEWEGG